MLNQLEDKFYEHFIRLKGLKVRRYFILQMLSSNYMPRTPSAESTKMFRHIFKLKEQAYI